MNPRPKIINMGFYILISNFNVRCDVSFEPDTGQYSLKSFNNADHFAREELVRIVRERARVSGTSCQEVTLETCDKIPTTAGGDPIFMGRTLYASLKGRPDIVLEKNPLKTKMESLV